MKNLACSKPRLWATPDRIRSVDDAVRQWTTLQMISEDRADAEAHARHSTEQVQHHHKNLPRLPNNLPFSLPFSGKTNNRFICANITHLHISNAHRYHICLTFLGLFFLIRQTRVLQTARLTEPRAAERRVRAAAPSFLQTGAHV
jgi:hypothetical protein